MNYDTYNNGSSISDVEPVKNIKSKIGGGPRATHYPVSLRVRLSEEMNDEVDKFVALGVYDTKVDLFRHAVQKLLDELNRNLKERK